MSNNTSTDDRIESATTHAEQSGRREKRDSGEPESGRRSSRLNRRGFLSATAAAGVAALTGFATESASAQIGNKEIIVTATGDGRHYYEIHLKATGDSVGLPRIRKGSDAEGNDNIRTVTTNGSRHRMVEGHVLGDRRGPVIKQFEDNYFYSGEIEYIIADGNLKFEFPSGIFRTPDDDRVQINVRARESGKHHYNISAQPGNIDKMPRFTGSNDNDLFDPSSERADTSDDVAGAVLNNNRDSYLLRAGKIHEIDTIGNMKIEVDDQ